MSASQQDGYQEGYLTGSAGGVVTPATVLPPKISMCDEWLAPEEVDEVEVVAIVLASESELMCQACIGAVLQRLADDLLTSTVAPASTRSSGYDRRLAARR